MNNLSSTKMEAAARAAAARDAEAAAEDDLAEARA